MTLLCSYREVGPGVLSLHALGVTECQELLASANCSGNWTQAEITNYDDKGMLGQYIDLEARNVEVKGPAVIPDLCRAYASLLKNQVLPIIQNRWGITGLVVSGPQLAKYQVGSHIRAHNDTATEFSARCVTAVLYLNADFEGGEIIFPRLNFTYRPTTGELLLFPSEYLHAVSPVLAGTRYCFVAFFLAEAFGNWVEKLHNIPLQPTAFRYAPSAG